MSYAGHTLRIFSGHANPVLAESVSKHLQTPLGQATCTTFSDGEIRLEIHEHVRGQDVFIIQSTCAPTHDHLMELLLFIDALHRSSAGRITAVIPYFGYARQDRRIRSARVPISAKLIANMLTAAGVDRVLTVDLHADQIQGFFNIPMDNIYASPLFLKDIAEQGWQQPLVISPDIGGVVRARALAKALNADLAILDKRRIQPNTAEILHIIGDVQNRDCLLIDDIIDTAGTLCQAAEALKQAGARSVHAYCTHAVLSGQAPQRLASSLLDTLVITDSIPLRSETADASRIRVCSLAPLLAEVIHRLHCDTSLSELF